MTTRRVGKGRFELVGALSLLALASGCLAHGAGATPAQLEAERSKARAAEQRVAELEQRLGKLEQLSTARAAEPSGPAGDSVASEKLDRLIVAQERLVERLAEVQAAPARPAAVTKKSSARDPVCRPSAELVGFEARLQDLIERAQTDLPPWRGGLSREKREALRILLREDRQLDGTLEL